MQQSKAIRKLGSDIEAAAVFDDFPHGSIIKWETNQGFTYAAIKVGGTGQWYTTSQRGYAYVPGILDYGELVEVLADPEVESVAVATEWSEL